MLFSLFLFCLIVAVVVFVYAGLLASQESAEGAIVAMGLTNLGLWLVVIAALVAVFVKLVQLGVIHPF